MNITRYALTDRVAVALTANVDRRTAALSVSDTARRWLRAVCAQPQWHDVRTMTRAAKLPVSTFLSVFFRAGLPSPKSILVDLRLCALAGFVELTERKTSVAELAAVYHYSSPQHLNRHLRQRWNGTGSHFIRHSGFTTTVDRWFTYHVATHVNSWRLFTSPLLARVADVIFTSTTEAPTP